MAQRSYNGRNIFAAENGDFESPAALSTKWGVGVGFAGAGTTITKGTNSTNYYKITWGTGGGFIDNTSVTYLPVNPGRSYTWSVRFRTNYVSGDSDDGASVGVFQFNAARNLIDAGSTGGNTRTPKVKVTQGWTTYTYTFTTNVKTASVQVNISHYGHTGTGNLKMDMDVDDITITEILPARLPATNRTAITQPRVAVRDMGTALSFNGTSNKVDFGTLPITTNEMTISIRFKPTMARSGTGAIYRLNESATPTNRLVIIADTSNQIFVFRNDSGGISSFSIIEASKRNVYTDIVVTESSTGIKVYVNGVLVGSSGTVKTYILNTFNALGVDGASNWFKGIIDEPRIWNRALSAQEVSDLYYNNIIPRTGLVGEWLFNEASGTTAFDTSGNGNDGTITGATYTTDVPLKLRNSI